jgi:hypothetical protein
LEKSYDVSFWANVTKVDGHGTTNEHKVYTYSYQDDYDGIIYYRLKQVDFDGNYEYSKIINVECLEDSPYTIYPNPVNEGEKFYIYNLKNSDKVSIYTMLGDLIYENSLSVGTYIILVNNQFIGKLIVK